MQDVLNWVKFLSLIEQHYNLMAFSVVVLEVGLLLGIYVLLYYFSLDIFGMVQEQSFRDVFAGIDSDIDDQVEFGAFQKLGDPSTRRQSV